MADGATDRTDAAGEEPGRAAKTPHKPLTDAQRRKRRREREAARRKAKAEAAENARRAAVPPGELVAQDDADRELTGAARTLMTAALYRDVFRRWTEGWSATDLADKYDLSERRVEQIISQLRGTELTRLGVGDTLFSVKFAQRLVLQRSAAVGQYARLAEEAPENQPQLKLGYLRLRDEALTKFTDLVQELGWLPKHLGTINTQMDALQMAEVLLEQMDAQGISVEVQRVIVEAIELRVVRRGAGLALAGVGPDLEGFAVDTDGEGEVHDGMGPGDSGDGTPGGGGDPDEGEAAHEPAAA
jgi:hypothetical protein